MKRSLLKKTILNKQVKRSQFLFTVLRCFDYGVFNEMIRHLRMMKTMHLNTFQQHVAAILMPHLRIFYACHFKITGWSGESRDIVKNTS